MNRMPTKRNILVVDDDLSIRKVLFKALEYEYEVSTLPSGLQLTEVIESFLPDLIILDVMLPWRDGFTLCKSIKESDRWRSIPVLFLTGKGTNQDFATGIKMGADAYLTKPFTIKNLLKKVSELLSRAGKL